MKKTLLFLLFSLSLFSASARLFSVSATINQNGVTPPNPNPPVTQTGTLTGTFDDVTGLLTFSITYSPCGPDIRFRSGAAGTNGPQIFSISSNCNPPTSGSSTLTATDITNLLAGNVYVELDYFFGKIRGQLALTLIFDTFNFAARNAFYGIGGYSFTQQTFPNGVQTNPYVVSGPSPQNDFSYSVSATGGIRNIANAISTNTTNTPISIQFNGNNVRKFSCQPVALNTSGTVVLNDDIQLTATTNLGNTATQTGGFFSGAFVGFSVGGNENEYIVSITATFPTTPSPAALVTLAGIMVGDNTPQNVALNLDGVNDYVSIPSTVGNFTTNQDFTVTCWVKPDPTQTAQSGQNPDENDIVGKWAGLGAGVNNNYPFVIRYLNENRTNVTERGKILVGQWDGTTFPTIISSTAVNDGKWHHVAFVKTGTILKLFIDGVQEGGVTDNASNATNNTTPLQFGRRGNNESYFKGEIDEVRIWNIGKTGPQIADERFCKTPPDATGLQASYNFSNGVPHDNNALISRVQDAVSTNHGTLNNFAKIGDASNFVTGQVKYVDEYWDGFTNDGSSWYNAFIDLQDALTPNTCNDLFDVWVAKGTYKPGPPAASLTISFNIPTGMRIYGGFEAFTKSINHRNRALIQTTNQTILSGDLGSNDIPFNFTNNRTDNSITVVNIAGSNVVVDGFRISGGKSHGIFIGAGKTNNFIKNNKVIDNNGGIYISGNTTTTIANSILSGNNSDGVESTGAIALNINNSLITNNGGHGVSISVNDETTQANITNTTIASNARYGVFVDVSPVDSQGASINILKNTLIYGNASGGIFTNVNSGGTANNTVTYSLVQGNAGGTNGNLNGNTVNPQFVSPLANTVRSDAGNYRLKDSSPCINVGDDVGVSPLDLDRNLRPKGGKTDMGAYESNVNMNEIISIATGNWETPATWNLDRIPLATDKVIMNGHTVTVTTPNAKAKNVEQKPSSDLKFNTGGGLQLNQ